MPPFFYAVGVGHVPGIYSSWEEAKKQIDGFRDNKHKKFRSKAEASAYLASFRQDASPSDNQIDELDQQFGSIQVKEEKTEVGIADQRVEVLRRRHGDKLVAFCAGSAPLNGQDGGTAAYTVSFPCENVIRSFPVLVDPSNNRADCLAAKAATSIANELDPKKTRSLVVYSRYQGLIKAMEGERWINNWQKNGWKNANKDPVAHRGTYEQLLEAEKLRKISWIFLDQKRDPDYLLKLHEQAHDEAERRARSANILTEENHQPIVTAVQTHVDGLRSGKPNNLNKVVHDNAKMYGFSGDTLIDGPIENLYNLDRLRGLATEAKTRINVLAITSTTAVVRVDMENDETGLNYTDFLTLIKANGGWYITVVNFHLYD
ncbi:RNase H [Phytophthora megakarya]|uniref:ribonuclease H n=1 Tax=Phytophthora megakarya TaxID=4795 RepID=A0A225UQ09_9STRA|nr:RNase H [Phytophthora megakarya]